jgi:hypothetical protein
VRTRCQRCRRWASTTKPCRVCGSVWPMVHCHNPKHLDHALRAVTWPDGYEQWALWPVGLDGEPIPMLDEAGRLNDDLNPCSHAHPHDSFVHMYDPHHEVEEPQKAVDRLAEEREARELRLESTPLPARETEVSVT